MTALFRLFVRNTATADGMNRVAAWIAGLSARLYHRWHANHRRGSRRNIEAHYDLGNALFELMLDETMCYSSGFFVPQTARSVKPRPKKWTASAGNSIFSLAIRCWKLAQAGAGCNSRGRQLRAPRDHDDDFARAIRLGPQTDEKLGERHHPAERGLPRPSGPIRKLVSIEMIEAVGDKIWTPISPAAADCSIPPARCRFRGS